MTAETAMPCIHRAGCPKPDVCGEVGHCTSQTREGLEAEKALASNPEMLWLRTVADGSNFFHEHARKCAQRLLDRLSVGTEQAKPCNHVVELASGTKIPFGSDCPYCEIDRLRAQLAAHETKAEPSSRCKHAHAHTDRNGNPICSDCGEEL